MSNESILRQVIEKNNGYLFTSIAVEKGITKPYLAKYVKENRLEKVVKWGEMDNSGMVRTLP